MTAIGIHVDPFDTSNAPFDTSNGLPLHVSFSVQGDNDVVANLVQAPNLVVFDVSGTVGTDHVNGSVLLANIFGEGQFDSNARTFEPRLDVLTTRTSCITPLFCFEATTDQYISDSVPPLHLLYLRKNDG